MAIIYTYPTKAFPTSEDLVLISDAADSNKTKNAKISSIQSLVSGVNSVNGLADAVLLDSTTGVSNNNLTRTTNPSTNTISYSLSNALNAITSFEEGTWDPILEFYTEATDTWADIDTVTGLSYFSKYGKYQIINKRVFCSYKLPMDNATGAAFICNGLRITGLPFFPDSLYGGSAPIGLFAYSSSFSGGNMTGTINAIDGTVELNYLTPMNQQPVGGSGLSTDFGGTVEVQDTGSITRVIPLADPNTGEGSQLFLNRPGATNTSRIGRYTNQWHGTINYIAQ